MQVILLAYLALFGDESLIQFVKTELAKLFIITDIGDAKYFLGVSIAVTEDGIVLSQKRW